MKAAGIIFSNIHDSTVPELTSRRTMASIPFGGRYRLIDFALSNMVNSGITKVGVITHDNYQSLLDHLGNGKDWDLARRTGGIKILPPFITAYDSAAAGRFNSTRLESLMGVMNFINRCTEDVMVLSDCDVICNVDLASALAAHEKSGADFTMITAKVNTDIQPLDSHTEVPVIDEEGRVIDIAEYSGEQGDVTICADIWLVRRTYLQRVVNDAISHGHKSFYKDVIARNLGKDKFYAHFYDGFFARINSLESYFRCSMRLLDPPQRTSLFYRRNLPIFTKVRNSTPTRYTPEACVKNSLIADGCVIEGSVENSILFRGVKVGKGTTVSNCILMQDTLTGENVRLSCVVTDKNVVIKDGRELCGHETMPFYIGKGVMV
ncbi:MAG: glucose-1-phosphate adenylyltransferase subunit GlgD [Ruminococcaceae bacterium]|nr:glucose-1-phosphate adenylyltransferase subunit GlgD [Oscillospiraceae bacterium]